MGSCAFKKQISVEPIQQPLNYQLKVKPKILQNNSFNAQSSHGGLIVKNNLISKN